MKLLVFKTLDGQPHHDIDVLCDDPSIDWHTDISWGKFKPISKEFIWSNIVPRGTFYVPNNDLAGLISIAHALFETGKITKVDLENINSANYWIMRREAKIMKWVDLFERVYFLQEGKLPLWLLAWGVIRTRQWGKIWGARYILRDRICNH